MENIRILSITLIISLVTFHCAEEETEEGSAPGVSGGEVTSSGRRLRHQRSGSDGTMPNQRTSRGSMTSIQSISEFGGDVHVVRGMVHMGLLVYTYLIARLS